MCGRLLPLLVSSVLLFTGCASSASTHGTFIIPLSGNCRKSKIKYRGTSSTDDDDVMTGHKCLVDIPYDKRTQIEIRHPKLAKHIFSSEANIRQTEEWFYKYLGIPQKQQKAFYKKLPESSRGGRSTIERLGRYRLHQWFKFFLKRDNVGLNSKQLRKMVLSRPQLLSYKLSNIEATTKFFREELGLSNDELISILQSYPSVLMYSIDNRLRPTVAFLRNEVLCTNERVKRICISYPNVFSHSLEKTLLPKLAFFKELGLKRSEVSQVVARFAPTLWLSEENLKSKLDFLADSLGMHNFELRIVVLSYPQILGLGIESNMVPKMRFFLKPEEIDNDNSDASLQDNLLNCGLSKSELKDFVLYQPALLAYSLEGRLKPRVALMKDSDITFQYSPRNIMSYTDEKFQAWLASQTKTWSLVE